MALKAKITKDEHGGLSEELQGHYTETDGKFVLDVTKVEGLALEDVSGLKKTVETLRQSEKDLTASVKATQNSLEAEKAKFAGIDANQARDLLSKVDEIQNWDGETKVAEAVKSAEAKFKAQLEELNTKHTSTVEQLQNDLTDAETQLQDAIVDSKITSAIHAEGGNVPLLLPHVKSHVNMVKDTAGKWKPEVINNEGTPRIGDNSGNPMTIDQLVQEMKSNETFAGAFAGVNSTGSGNRGGNNDTGSNNHKTTKAAKVVDSTDGQAMSDNLESIAEGKTIVNMKSGD